MQIKRRAPAAENLEQRAPPPAPGGGCAHVRRISISDRVNRGPAAATRLIAPAPSIHLVRYGARAAPAPAPARAALRRPSGTERSPPECSRLSDASGADGSWRSSGRRPNAGSDDSFPQNGYLCLRLTAIQGSKPAPSIFIPPFRSQILSGTYLYDHPDQITARG